MAPPAYALGDLVATREAYGTAIAKLGEVDPRVVALDADVKNSTFSERFEAKHPDRFYQCFIAEQLMIGAAMGLASRGALPFPSTFATFLSRAADFIRMAAISGLNVKMAGSHAGVSIGEDGASQMALEDLAMMSAEPNMTVLYPSDAVCAERLVALGRLPSRAGLPPDVASEDAGDLRQRRALPDRRLDGAAAGRRTTSPPSSRAGVTLFEALKAHDLLAAEGIAIRVVDAYSVQPIDADTLRRCARETGRLITVEDHYAVGGLGDAVARAVAGDAARVTRLAVREIPRSGTPDQLLDVYGLSARRIAEAVRAR